MSPIRSEIVMACVSAATAMSLIGCASAPAGQAPAASDARAAPSVPPKSFAPRDAASVDKREFVKTLNGSVVFYFGEYHCAEGSHPQHKLYGDCDGIPAVVLLKPGGCIGLLPYKSLTIHSEMKRTKVVWQIFGPPHYAFDTRFDGIALSATPGDPSVPSDNYDKKDNGGRKFKWELKESVPTRLFYHLPNIVDTSTTPPTPCEPIDPRMINLIK